LVFTLRTGFNERLSRKVLAIVDEIREGGRDTQWEHSEKMKSLIDHCKRDRLRHLPKKERKQT
jgi:hypothetical protein